MLDITEINVEYFQIETKCKSGERSNHTSKQQSLLKS